MIKEVLPELTKKYGLEPDKKLSKKNDRLVFRNKQGEVFALDTQHGRFEKNDPKTGRHKGEFDFDMQQTKPADKSGKHDLKV